MSAYTDVVKTEKKYTGNVVIKIGDFNYFAIRLPDSGLNIQSPHRNSVASLTLNPTSIDIRKVTTTISSFSFRILDKDGIITSLVGGNAEDLIGAEVRIYLGRSNVDMDFSDYFELPVTYVSKLEHGDSSYLFSTSEQTERMNKPIYDYKSALGVDILVGTTTWTMRDDITDFPDTGFLKVDDEFVSYAGKDLVNNRFTGVIRGELGSTPAAHSSSEDCVLVETITDNPLNIIMKLLVSGGGGGTYDTLQSGLAIDENLIDIAEIEELRDELFIDTEFTLSLYEIPSALKLIETELLMPNGLRFSTSTNSKVTLAVLDKAQFVEEEDIIDEDTITKFPKWVIDGNKVSNIIEIRWNYSEGTKSWVNRNVYRDEDSILAYGAQTPLKFDFKGVKLALDGQALVDDLASRLLARLAFPSPEITINTHIDKSLQTIGDKAYLVSSKIPAVDGSLNFASDLEIVSRAINQTSGDVTFKLSFTSFTAIRSGFIAPSDLITSFISQRKVNVAAGRGEQYMVGWYMRLWDVNANEYTADAPNKIVGKETASGYLLDEDGNYLVTEDGERILLDQDELEDSIIFEDDWTTILTAPNNYRIRFANYDEQVTSSQKRYAFISEETGLDFADGKPSYKVTY